MEERMAALETNTMSELRTGVAANVRELEERIKADRDEDRKNMQSQLQGAYSKMEESRIGVERKLTEGLQRVDKEIQDMQNKMQRLQGELKELKGEQEGLKGELKGGLKGGQEEVERKIKEM